MPVTVISSAPGQGYTLQATIVFRDSLFRSKVNVTPDGMVNLFEEELLVEDMPLLDDTFGQ